MKTPLVIIYWLGNEQMSVIFSHKNGHIICIKAECIQNAFLAPQIVQMTKFIKIQ